MIAAPRRALLASLVLPLALWSALPDFQWCSMRWADVVPECFVECATNPSCTAATRCAPEDCASSCAVDVGCEADRPAAASGPIVADAPPGASPCGEDGDGRAWCLGDPAGPGRVEPVPSLGQPDQALHSYLALPAPPVARESAFAPDEGPSRPRHAGPRARPPARAPPHA